MSKKLSSLASFLTQEAQSIAGPSPGESAVESEILRRAALLRWFDPRLYKEAVVQKLGEAPSFETFAARPEVGVLSDRDRTFAIRDSSRDALLDMWRAEPKKLQQFSATLVRYFEKRDSPIDVFAHRIFASPKHALEEFQRLYKNADRRFDMVECDTLLRILRNRGDLRGPELTEALNNREQYFRSRSLFGDDWLRTAHFLQRPLAAKKFRKFLADEDQWLLRFSAPGGLGKTAFLRWLIARHCIPELGSHGTRIPVARVDFDFVHLPAVEAAPWLLLALIADQLNTQMAGAPFFTFLLDLRNYLPALQRPVSFGRTAALPAFDPVREAQTIQRFAGSLGTDRVVIVLDTMEELILHHGTAVRSLLELLSQVRAHCPWLKVIVSGRYDPFLRDSDGELRLLRSGSIAVRLKPWSKQECWDYLRNVRKMRPAMTYRKFLSPGKGNPFKVSLFADLVGRERAFTVADIRELRRLEVEHLVERIIERIPESQCALRWLLRYAALPLQLTEDFVEQVIAPRLRIAMAASGPDAPDLPNEKLPVGAGIIEQRKPWKSCTQAFETSEQWAAMQRYAGPANWVEFRAGVPRLKPELVSPMRYLLQEQPIFWDIHRDAVAYFETLAADPARDWGDLSSQAIFHRFQLEGDTAGTYWEQCLSRPEAVPRETRDKLVSCLLSSDFLDDQGKALPHKRTGTILKPETLERARLEKKMLRFVELLENQESIERIGGKVSAAQFEPLAIPGIENFMQSGPFESAVLVAKARSAFESGDKKGGCAALAAAAAVARQRPSMIPLPRILDQLSRAGIESGDFASALQAAEEALRLRGNKPQADEFIDNLKTLIAIDRACAEWNRGAIRLQALPPNAQGHPPFWAARLDCLLALDTFDPARIGRNLRGAVTQPVIDPRLDGLAAAMTGDVIRAENLLSTWSSRSSSDPRGATQMRVEHIQVLVRDIRDLRRAGTFINQARDLGDFQLRVEMLLLEVQIAAADRPSALARWTRLQEDRDGWTNPQGALVLATGLALQLASPAEFETLLGVLAEIEPASARLPHLKPFALFTGQAPQRTGVSLRFHDLFPVPPDDHPDFVFQTLLLVEALRFLGDRNSAASMLKVALKHPSLHSVYSRRQVILAMMRLGLVVEVETLLTYSADVSNTASRQFQAIAHLELAEWFILREDWARVSLALESPRPPESTQYRMRRFQAEAALASANAESEKARESLASAKAIAEQLGIPFAETSLPPPISESPFPPENVLRFSLDGPQRLRIDYRPSGGAPMQGTANIELVPVFRALLEGDPLGLFEALASPKELGASLAKMIPVNLEKRPANSAANLRIEFATTDQLSGLPWEWATNWAQGVIYRSVLDKTLERERLEWFTARLKWMDFPIDLSKLTPTAAIAQIEKAQKKRKVFLDTWSGPKTKLAIAKAVPSVVAIVKPSTEAERSAKSGSGSAGISIEHIYRERKLNQWKLCEPWQLVKSRPDELENFDVFHICLPLREVNGLFGLSDGESSSFLTPAFLDLYGPGYGRPIVILDVPRPSRARLWAQQLVWRNLFAMDLFMRGHVDAVIATGLGGRNPRKFAECLVDAIRNHEPACELVKVLNQLEPDSATILYAYDPEVPLG